MKYLTVSKYKDKVPISTLTEWLGLPRSSWYYKPSNGRRGIQPSSHTTMSDGSVVKNEAVVDQIKKLFSSGLDFYGYEKTTWELHDLDFIINKKKVYRLMKEANLLLLRQRISTQGKRNFVQFRCIDAQRPLEYLSMDIKYVYIDEEKRYAYLLTVLDIYSRFVVGHTLKYSIKKTDVVLLLDGILHGVSAKGLIIRNDNGSQFIAHNVRNYLKGIGVIQEFTHIATPEENSYIESHFSVLEREFLKRNWFESLFDARMKLEEYYKIYCFRRKQKALKRKSPFQYLKTHFPEFADKHPFSNLDSFPTETLMRTAKNQIIDVESTKKNNINDLYTLHFDKELVLN